MCDTIRVGTSITKDRVVRHNKGAHNDKYQKREREIWRNTVCKGVMIMVVPTDSRTPS